MSVYNGPFRRPPMRVLTAQSQIQGLQREVRNLKSLVADQEAMLREKDLLIVKLSDKVHDLQARLATPHDPNQPSLFDGGKEDEPSLFGRLLGKRPRA